LKIWIDFLTPKQLLYLEYTIKRLTKKINYLAKHLDTILFKTPSLVYYKPTKMNSDAFKKLDPILTINPITPK
jgi:hypothetical protein